jgi:cytochrome P450
MRFQDLTSWPSFGKPLEMYKLLAHQGQNVLITEGEEHRRHRKIAAPAFSEANTALVWQDTQDVAHEFFQSIDRQAETRTDGSRATTLDAPLTMLRVALHIIARAGFGHSSAYDDSAAPPPGHHYTFIEAVTVASEHALAKAFLPDFVYRLPFLPRKVKASLDKTWSAYDEFETYLSEMIEERVHSQEDKHDLFSLLVKDMAGDSEEDTGTKLSTREVKGNIFIMLLAGHGAQSGVLRLALIAGQKLPPIRSRSPLAS